MKSIKELAEHYYEEVKDIRHKLHMNPELSLNEVATSKLIQDELTKKGIAFEVVYNTGVLATIQGSKPGKVVLLRADMDALEVNEEADVAYKSTKPGLMHACGHDGHTAGLLGAAMILNDLREDLAGTVKLMFQPAEEKDGGAKPMIEAGILENPKVDAAFGLHLWGPVKRGKVAVKSGAMMGAPTSFKAKIIGKGTHAAMPNLGIDPVVLACQAVNNIQMIIPRQLNPLTPAVISICKIHGGDAFNVVPEFVEFAGTIRTLDYDTRDRIPKLMENVIAGVCQQADASYELEVEHLYPPLINDAKMSEFARQSIAKVIGEENVYELEEPSLGGEDFAFLCENVPSAFFFVGIAEEGKPAPVHHHPKFQWEDDVLKETSQYLSQIAYDFLNE